MRYYVLCMRISNISIYVRTEMCTSNTFVSTLIWKRLDRLYQTNMHLIMRIENAFKFCGKLIHFYNERISILFYCEVGKRGAVSWLSLNAVEVKQTSHLLDVCRFRWGGSSDSSMVSFGNPLRIFRFPPSLIQPVLYIGTRGYSTR